MPPTTLDAALTVYRNAVASTVVAYANIETITDADAYHVAVMAEAEARADVVRLARSVH